MALNGAYLAGKGRRKQEEVEERAGGRKGRGGVSGWHHCISLHGSSIYLDLQAGCVMASEGGQEEVLILEREQERKRREARDSGMLLPPGLVGSS